MKKITPHLWYDKEAKEAAEFYTTVFPNSRITNVSVIHDTPSGDCDIVSFELFGQPFMSISAGPYFKFTPAVSFMVSCETKEEVDKYWNRLSDGGNPLMPLNEYPFSERYGWVEDRYGLSWQIIYVEGQEITQKIRPVFLFTGKVSGRAEEAMRFYTSVFPDSRIGDVSRYGEGESPNPPEAIKYGPFILNGQSFVAMDSALEPAYPFNEAISFIIYCKTQEDIDYFWDKLSAVPEAEQCGWLKDKFGLSWQVVPEAMDEMMSGKDPEGMNRVTKAYLKMKKFDLAVLEKAYAGVV